MDFEKIKYAVLALVISFFFFGSIYGIDGFINILQGALGMGAIFGIGFGVGYVLIEAGLNPTISYIIGILSGIAIFTLGSYYYYN